MHDAYSMAILISYMDTSLQVKGVRSIYLLVLEVETGAPKPNLKLWGDCHRMLAGVHGLQYLNLQSTTQFQFSLRNVHGT